MIVKNINRLVRSNIGTLLKSLIYQFVILAIVVGLCLPFAGILVDCYSVNASVFDASSSIVLSGWASFGHNMNNTAIWFVSGTLTLFETNAFVGIYLIFVVGILMNFLFNIIRIIISEGLYGYMSSLSKTTFFQSMFKHIGRAMKYSLWRTIVDLVCNALVFAGLVGLLLLPTSVHGWMPVIVILYLGLSLTIKEILFAGIAPAMIVYNFGIRKSVKKGIKVTATNIWQIWAYIIVVSLLFTTVAVFLSVYSLLVIIPACVYVFSVAEMLFFFEAQGMRYYINMQEIVAPKKLEERDNIKKVKYIV